MDCARCRSIIELIRSLSPREAQGLVISCVRKLDIGGKLDLVGGGEGMWGIVGECVCCLPCRIEEPEVSR